MNDPGLPEAITAGSLVLAVFVVGNMICRIKERGSKRRKPRRKLLSLARHDYRHPNHLKP
jgi:hypothetical protein